MTPRAISVLVVVGGGDAAVLELGDRIGLRGNHSWRSRDGRRFEWGVQVTGSFAELEEPVLAVLDLVEPHSDAWRAALQGGSSCATMVCTVDMRGADCTHGEFPVLRLPVDVMKRIVGLGLELDVVFR